MQTFKRPITRFCRFSAMAAATVLLLLAGSACGQNEDLLDPFASYEYFESALPEIGARTLLLHSNGATELNTFKDKISMNIDDNPELAAAVSDLKTTLSGYSHSDWDQQYAKVGAPWYRRLRRIHPEGVTMLEYHADAEAPAKVSALMDKFHAIVEIILRANQSADTPS